MASDNDAILDVISVVSNSSKKISQTVKNKQYTNTSQDSESQVSEQFKNFRSDFWGKHAELNTHAEVVTEEVPSIVVGNTAVFYPRRPRI